MSTYFDSPLLVGRRAAPTNDGSGPIVRQFPTTVVALSVNSPDNKAVTFYVPQGSAVLRIRSIFTGTTPDAAATVAFTLATNPALSITSSALGASNRVLDFSFGALTQSQISTLTNIGTNLVSGTIAITSAAGPQQASHFIELLVRNADGSQYVLGEGPYNTKT